MNPRRIELFHRRSAAAGEALLAFRFGPLLGGSNQWPVTVRPSSRSVMAGSWPAWSALDLELLAPRCVVNGQRLWRHAIRELIARLLPHRRRRRANPRVVKRKYTRWHVKRSHHRRWPQPTGPPLITITPPN